MIDLDLASSLSHLQGPQVNGLKRIVLAQLLLGKIWWKSSYKRQSDAQQDEEDGSKYRLKFVLDRKELTLTLDDFRRIFQLPQATNNIHECFVVALKFSEMVLFFLNDLVFTLELRSPSNFKTTGLMLYCFVNNMHVDYAELLWEGLHYALEHPSTLVPYLRFTKLIVGHCNTAYPRISKRVHDKYHNLEHDEMVKSIFNAGKNNVGVGIKIPSWMITDEMKLTENYQMYAEVFRVEVPTTHSHPIESSLGQLAPLGHLTLMCKRRISVHESLCIRLRFHKVGQTRLTPPTTVPTIAEVEDMTLQDTIQLSIIEQKSRDDFEARQNVEKVNEYLEDEEIKKMVEVKKKGKGKHVEESRNTPSPIPIRSPRTHSTPVSSDTEKLQELTVTDSKSLSSTPSSSSPKPTLSCPTTPLSLFQTQTGRFKLYKIFFDELQGRYSYLFGHLKTRFLARNKFNVLD
ncbi:hypothetical protein Tco_0793686 [Tanacetum coccineum]